MKNKIILTFFLFLILIIGITTSSYAMFVIEDFTIDSELKDNGDLYVTERITYCTNEYVNGLTRKIITKNPRNTKNSADSLELNYVKVDGEEYNYTKSGHIGESGIYEYTTKGTKEYNIKVYSPFINETKVVEYSYVLENVGVKYKDTAELFWNFIGDEWDCSIENLQINITLPEEAAEGTIYVFGHGADNGTFVKNENYITLKANNLSAYQPIDSRILFPKDAIIFSNKFVNKNVLDKYINEEESINKAIGEKNIIGNLSLKNISIILSSIILVFIVYVYIEYDKEHMVEKVKYYREIPFNLEPELLQYLYYGKIKSNSYYIAVLNLIKLGIFKLDKGNNVFGEKNDIIIYNEKNDVKLKGYQERIVETVKGYMQKDEKGNLAISLSKLSEKMAKSTGASYTLYKVGLKSEKKEICGLKQKVPKTIKVFSLIFLLLIVIVIFLKNGANITEDFMPMLMLMGMIQLIYPVAFADVKGAIYVILFLMFHFSCFAGALYMLMMLNAVEVLFIPYILNFIFTIYINRAKKASIREMEIKEQIKGLRNYIKDYSMLAQREDLGYINLWEDYFIISIALNLNKKVVNYFYNYGREQINSNLGASIYSTNSFSTFNYNMSKPFYSYYRAYRLHSNTSRSSGSGFSGSSGGFSGGRSSGGRGGRRRRRK